MNHEQAAMIVAAIAENWRLPTNALTFEMWWNGALERTEDEHAAEILRLVVERMDRPPKPANWNETRREVVRRHQLEAGGRPELTEGTLAPSEARKMLAQAREAIGEAKYPDVRSEHRRTPHSPTEPTPALTYQEATELDAVDHGGIVKSPHWLDPPKPKPRPRRAAT